MQLTMGRARRVRTKRASRMNMQLTPRTAHIQPYLAESEGPCEVAESREPAVTSVGYARAWDEANAVAEWSGVDMPACGFGWGWHIQYMLNSRARTPKTATNANNARSQ